MSYTSKNSLASQKYQLTLEKVGVEHEKHKLTNAKSQLEEDKKTLENELKKVEKIKSKLKRKYNAIEKLQFNLNLVVKLCRVENAKTIQKFTIISDSKSSQTTDSDENNVHYELPTKLAVSTCEVQTESGTWISNELESTNGQQSMERQKGANNGSTPVEALSAVYKPSQPIYSGLSFLQEERNEARRLWLEMQKHPIQDEFACEICGRKFKKQRYATRHMRASHKIQK